MPHWDTTDKPTHGSVFRDVMHAAIAASCDFVVIGWVCRLTLELALLSDRVAGKALTPLAAASRAGAAKVVRRLLECILAESQILEVVRG